MSGAHVAQMNFGRLRYSWDDPRTAPFAGALAAVNAVALRSPGFVWMMPEAEMDAEQRDPGGVFGGDPRIASTLSVWASVESLRGFVFNTVHGRFLARGREWFEPPEAPNFVMWPVPPGARPSMSEAMARMRRLAQDGPGPDAFDWAWAARNAERRDT